MPRVTNINEARKKKESKKPDVITYADVEAELEKNIDTLCQKLNCDREKAIEVASNFYRSYPMLMEHVRDSVGR